MVEPFASRDTFQNIALIVVDWLSVHGVLEFFREQIKLWETKVERDESRDQLGPAPLHNSVNRPLSLPDHCVRLAWVYKDMIETVRKVRDYAPDIVPGDWVKQVPCFFVDGPKQSGLSYHSDQIPEHGLRESLAVVRAELIKHGFIVPEYELPQQVENTLAGELIERDSSPGYTDGGAESVRAKRSTEPGEARAKIIAGLTAHHCYENGSCLNWDPIGVNELARLVQPISSSSISRFFAKQFGGHGTYRAACADKTRLIHALAILNDELTPKILFGTSCDEVAAAE